MKELEVKLGEAEASLSASAGYPERLRELEAKLQEAEVKLTEAKASMTEAVGVPEKLKAAEERLKQKEIELSALQKRNQVC